jgi:hypothetical protein
MPNLSPRLRLGLVLLVSCHALAAATAAPPQITRVGLPALQPGVAATLAIDGTDLLPNPRLVLPVPVASQAVKDGGMANRVQIEVKLADTASPGIYHLRLANDKGISNAVLFAVETLPQEPFAPQVAKMPVALQATLSGSTTLSTTLAGKKGQRLVVETVARRVGAAVDPVVKLFDPQRVQRAWAQGSTPTGGDTRLVTELPADGVYTLEVHDARYQAGNPNQFLLKIGDLQYADLPFPLAGRQGSKASFQLLGSLPETTRVEADLTAAVPGSFLPLPQPPGLAGPAPRVLVSDVPEVMESEPSPGKLQELAVPAAVNGRLRMPGEEDRYRVPVQPGMKLRFDVLAERAGSPLDGVLTLRNETGAQLARSDDQPGTLDPGLEFTVPAAGVTAVVAVVADVHGRGGPEFVYRLAVTPVGQPDFSLSLTEDRQQVPRNGSALLRVKATRTGYNGPIKLTLTGLPPGVAVAGDEIPAGAGESLLSFTAPEGAPVVQEGVSVVGAGTEGGVSLRRLALQPDPPPPARGVPPWLRGELAVAVTEAAPLAVAWEAVEGKLPLGGQIPAKLKISRGMNVKGQVRLSLLTTQVVPKGKDGKDDVNRALRLEGMPTVAAEQSAGEIKIVVPADLPPLAYDLAIRAELLGPDGKTVVATAVTPSRRALAAK